MLNGPPCTCLQSWESTGVNFEHPWVSASQHMYLMYRQVAIWRHTHVQVSIGMQGFVHVFCSVYECVCVSQVCELKDVCKDLLYR